MTFSEAVEVSTGRPHFEFNTSLGIRQAAYESGSGTTALVFAYTVLAADWDDNGIWIGRGSDTLKLDSGEYIRSVATMNNARLLHSSLGTQSGHKVRGSAPTISSVAVTSSPDNSTGYVTDEKIEFTVTFSEAVEVSTGRPQFEFATALGTRLATYESGSGTTALVFAYTVQAADWDDNGIWIGRGSDALKLESGEYIRSVANMVDAQLAHSSLGTQSGHKVRGGTPTISNVAVTSSPDTGDTYAADEKIQFTVTFSEAVEVSTGRPHFEFSTSLGTRRAAYESGSGTTALVFAYTVQGGDQDDNGIWIGRGSDTLKLESGEYIRSAANMVDAQLAHSSLGTQSGHKVDAGAPPTVSSVAVTSSPDNSTAYAGDEEIEFTVTFSEAVEVSAGRPHLEFSLGPNGEDENKPAGYKSGSGTTALVFSYTVQPGDQDQDGIWIGDHERTLKLESGEYIRSVATMFNAHLAHSELGTQSSHKVDAGTPPTVSSVAVTSSPDDGTAYAADEEIEFTVTFSEAVEVSVGRPHFEFSLGPSGAEDTKQAAYESGSGTTALVFAYTVQAGDQDDDGISVGDGSDTLKLESGEYIRSVAHMVNAALTHAALGTQSGHKVEAGPHRPFPAWRLRPRPPMALPMSLAR